MAEVLLFHHVMGQTPGFFAFADELRQAGHTVHTPNLLDGRTFGSIDEGLAYVGEIGFGEVIGRGDQAASAVGNGIVEEGIVSCTLGTSGVVFAHMEKVAYDPAGRVHTFCHAVRDKWHVMGVTQGAGLSLRWFRDQFGVTSGDLTEGDPYDSLTAEAARVPRSSPESSREDHSEAKRSSNRPACLRS